MDKIIAKYECDRQDYPIKAIYVLEPENLDPEKPDYTYIEIWKDERINILHYPTVQKAIQVFSDQLNPEAWLPF